MARAATQEAEEDTEKPAAAAGGMPSGKLILIVVIVLSLLLTISVGLAAFFALRSSASHQASAEGDSAETSSDEQPASKGKEKGKEKGKDEKKEKEAKKAPPIYLDMTPAFVVNLQDDQAMRYLQIEIQLMTRDPKAAEEVKTRIPRIRNTLMLLFAQQHAKDLITREAKEGLQQQALAQVQAVMKDETGSTEVEDVYFTSFVIQ